MSWRGIINLLRKRPLSVSLEITHSCNCNCQHCDKGNIIKNEYQAPPERFAEHIRILMPPVAQISGGEPLLRKDVYEIVRQIKLNKHFPHVVLVTNGWLLTIEKYLKLKSLGVDEFSISLDFPDERHDENRKISGLYQHLNDLIPKLAKFGNEDIILINVICRNSISEMLNIIRQAETWNTKVVFSSYTPLRTGDYSLALQEEDQFNLLSNQIEKINQSRLSTRVLTSPTVLKKYYTFFKNNCNISNCKAGYRSLVINPDGTLAPCAMKKISYNTHDELIKNFSKSNRCGGCYVSLRANTEKNFYNLIKDGWSFQRKMRQRPEVSIN